VIALTGQPRHRLERWLATVEPGGRCPMPQRSLGAYATEVAALQARATTPRWTRSAGPDPGGAALRRSSSPRQHPQRRRGALFSWRPWVFLPASGGGGAAVLWRARTTDPVPARQPPWFRHGQFPASPPCGFFNNPPLGGQLHRRTRSPSAFAAPPETELFIRAKFSCGRRGWGSAESTQQRRLLSASCSEPLDHGRIAASGARTDTQ